MSTTDPLYTIHLRLVGPKLATGELEQILHCLDLQKEKYRSLEDRCSAMQSGRCLHCEWQEWLAQHHYQMADYLRQRLKEMKKTGGQS